MRKICFLLSFIFQFYLFSQENKKVGTLYFGWGYNRDWYSKSDIHLQNNQPQFINGKYYTYDFTVYNTTAQDRPEFEKIKDVVNISVPQFGFRVGYFFSKYTGWGVELNYDHAKYVVDDYQKVRIKGQINGQELNKDTILNPTSFLHFEHTDGANFWMINLVKRWKLWSSISAKNNVGIILKPGIDIVYPRTDVTLFGNRINNNWKISGIDAGLEFGLRTEFLGHYFLEFTCKGVYANYINALVQGKGNGKASQHFFAFEAIVTAGWRLRI